MTQVEAAKLLEMRQAAISYYCNVERAPRPHILRLMADRLGVSPAELTGEKETGEPKSRVLSKISSSAPPDQAVCQALNDLKKRWKKKSHERDTINHLIAALFPKDAAQILAWLNEP